MLFFILGSALRGQPDNKNLGEAKFIREAATAARYRLHAVRDYHPALYQVDSNGVSVAGELYDLTDEQHAHLMANEPPDLYEDDVVLEDGSTVRAMVYPQALVEKFNWPDISEFGGWAAFLLGTRR